jgi:hypothetical protein
MKAKTKPTQPAVRSIANDDAEQGGNIAGNDAAVDNLFVNT